MKKQDRLYWGKLGKQCVRASQARTVAQRAGVTYQTLQRYMDEYLATLAQPPVSSCVDLENSNA